MPVRSHRFEVPSRLAAEVARFREGAGLEWLGGLPGLIADAVDRWGLALGEPFSYPSLSYVAPAALPDGSQAVLKIGFLVDELASEVEALRAFDGRGAIRLLQAIPEQGVLLLERAVPGDALLGVQDDDEATTVAAGVMQELWRPAPAGHPFRTVARWARGFGRLRERFGGGTGPLPAHLVEMAEAWFAEMEAAGHPEMLLHGDLQHHNILRAEREPWLAIDPKGVVGDPAYEVGPLLYNRLEGAADPAWLLARRLEVLVGVLGIDRERLRRWGLIAAVLSAWWTIEDSGEPEQWPLRGPSVLAAEVLAGLPGGWVATRPGCAGSLPARGCAALPAPSASRRA